MKGKKILISRSGDTPIIITINDADAIPFEDFKVFLLENIFGVIAIYSVDFEK